MTKLNCGVGDLAITVTCLNPENLGNIVEILKPLGFRRWINIAEQVFTWEVLAVGENSWLLYEIEGWPVTKKIGYVPDLCLRRITPPKSKKKNSNDIPEQGNLDLLFKNQKESNKEKQLKEEKIIQVAHVLI
jgi:pyruvate/2-oxoacid:ferredoxin oxidoreductase beta subunit